jgi:hypothetical protein
MNSNNTQAIEELLVPRYKVIDLFPFNQYFSIGDIIECEHLDDREHLATHERYAWLEPLKNSSAHNTTFYESEFNKYPHLFRRLEWWEERQPEEMPKYLKDKTGVFKTRDWRLIGAVMAFDIYITGSVYSIDGWHELSKSFLPNYLPATEAEYLNQQK